MPEGAGLDATWLEHRFDLFERLCLPAMGVQKATVTWLVFFDALTPTDFMVRAENYHTAVSSLEIVIVDGRLTDTRIAQYVRARLPGAEVRLCTTRLDNDDAIATRYLARVQAEARSGQVPRFINFPLGYQWYDNGLYLWIDRANPFVSFVETVAPGTTPQTVMCDRAHSEIRAVASVQQVIASPAWVQVVHSRNVANTLRGVRRLRSTQPRTFVGQSAVADNDTWPARLRDFVGSLGSIVTRIARRMPRVGRSMS